MVHRFLHPLAARNSFYYPLVLAPLYLTIGPWFVGNVLSDSVGKNIFFVGKIKHLFSYSRTTYLQIRNEKSSQFTSQISISRH